MNTYGADDGGYWKALQPPAAPSLDDFATFSELILGERVLLLGSTDLLLPLATEAWDVSPLYDSPKIVQKNWFSLDERFDTIIGDGVLTFDRDDTERLVELCSHNCSRLVCRSFLNPSWPTRYAKYFPRQEDFSIRPGYIPVNEVYCFYVWDFDV